MDVIWSDSALKQLRQLERRLAKRIYEKVGGIAERPWHFVRKVADSNYFKMRIGDYRAIVDIIGNRIEILKVGHRKNIYKQLP